MSWTLDILILEELLVYESYIKGKMIEMTSTTKGYRVKKCSKLCILMCEDLLVFMHETGMSVKIKPLKGWHDVMIKEIH